MTDRELMQRALDALDYEAECGNDDAYHPLRHALRDRLAQPDAYGYASRLAVAIWEQHYKDVAPQWKPLDDLMGVLTQIDNMTSGLTRLAQPEQEPVAWVYPEGVEALNAGKPWTAYGTRQEPNNIALYLSPQPEQEPVVWCKEWVGLTDEEIERACVPLGAAMLSFTEVARAIEAKLRERNA